MTLQDLLEQCRFEVLATTKLPMAIGFLSTELKHCGILAEGMKRLHHYFTPFQTFVVEQSELDSGRFDFQTALSVLRFEAEYRAKSDNRQGFFFYQFEVLCRNRLNYDQGLKAMSDDPLYSPEWREWILIVRQQLGIVEIADLIYGRSEEFVHYRKRHLGENAEAEYPILFGEREGENCICQSPQRTPISVRSHASTSWLSGCSSPPHSRHIDRDDSANAPPHRTPRTAAQIPRRRTTPGDRYHQVLWRAKQKATDQSGWSR